MKKTTTPATSPATAPRSIDSRSALASVRGGAVRGDGTGASYIKSIGGGDISA
jgi:hypothetical protein